MIFVAESEPAVRSAESRYYFIISNRCRSLPETKFAFISPGTTPPSVLHFSPPSSSYRTTTTKIRRLIQLQRLLFIYYSSAVLLEEGAYTEVYWGTFNHQKMQMINNPERPVGLIDSYEFELESFQELLEVRSKDALWVLSDTGWWSLSQNSRLALAEIATLGTAPLESQACEVIARSSGLLPPPMFAQDIINRRGLISWNYPRQLQEVMGDLLWVDGEEKRLREQGWTPPDDSYESVPEPVPMIEPSVPMSKTEILRRWFNKYEIDHPKQKFPGIEGNCRIEQVSERRYVVDIATAPESVRARLRQPASWVPDQP